MPDDCLAGLGPQTAIIAAEPCTAGPWERVPGGYRVLDGEAIEVCIDRMRELRKSRIPSGPYMTGAAAAVILASP